jgi:hypothetical protein
MEARSARALVARPGFSFSCCFHCTLSTCRCFRRPDFLARRSRCFSSGSNSVRPTTMPCLLPRAAASPPHGA